MLDPCDLDFECPHQESGSAGEGSWCAHAAARMTSVAESGSCSEETERATYELVQEARKNPREQHQEAACRGSTVEHRWKFSIPLTVLTKKVLKTFSDTDSD